MRDKTKYQRYYRRPRTRQEKRANCKYNDKWCRDKRKSANLPDLWNEWPCCCQQTWKVKRKKQYRVGGRGKKNTLFLPRYDLSGWRLWVNTWQLEDYFRNHDIPYRLETVERRESRDSKHYFTTLYLTWWSNKNIDIEKIILQTSEPW